MSGAAIGSRVVVADGDRVKSAPIVVAPLAHGGAISGGG